jgi:hypothetical protein
MEPSVSGAQEVVEIAAAEQGTWVVGSMREDSKLGSWALAVQELPRGNFYDAAAFDVERQLVFLARRGTPSLEVADLASESSPKPLVEVGSAVSQIEILAYDAGTRRLFASDGRSSVLAIDVAAMPPRVQVVASGLDRPSALAFDNGLCRLYVATSGDGALWKLVCAPECSAPSPFASAAQLRRPRTLAVDARSVVWAGDLENELIVAFSAAGELLQTVERLPPSF